MKLRLSFHSLRSRLLVIQSGIVIGLMIATLAYVSLMANRRVGERILLDLARSRETVAAAEMARYRALDLVAQLVASFPNLRALLATDTATVRDFLNEFRQQHDRDELFIAIDGEYKLIARSDSFAPLEIPRLKEAWIDPALAGKTVRGEFEVDGRIYQGVLAPAEVGGTMFGFILAAAPVDDAWARSLRDASDKEIVILSRSGVAGSTVLSQHLPWRSLGELPVAKDASAALDVRLDTERYQAVVVPGAGGSLTRVLSLQSLDAALRPYQSIQIGLLVIGLVVAALGVAGSALFARSLTAPIGQLVEATRNVAAGHFDAPVNLARADELGDLATSFNSMMAGLREREDMQKFMSQSAVAMIQRDSAPERRQGERRVVTLLFCDIRGFTAFAEHRPPEEAVAVLNRYLHLQADLVKKFHGDVDKFMGDAIFAQFAGPDMALDAIRCGIEIQRAVTRVSLDDPSLPVLAVGVGIATGDVIVGSIGSHDRLDYTAIGPAVNLGSRLCSAAEPHEILMSESTFALVRDLVAAEPVPPLAVKGFSEPVQAYRMKIV